MNFRARIVFCLMLLVVASLLSGYASASTYYFTLTGPSNTLTFALPSSPVPSFSNSGAFALYDTTFSNNGVASTEDFFFFTSGFDGGFAVCSARPCLGVLPTIVTDGPQLFTGTTANPAFSLGTFSLIDSPGDTPILSGPFRLTISQTPTAVPEPATLGLFGVGFGLIGRKLRKCH